MVATARAWPQGARFVVPPPDENPVAAWLRALREDQHGEQDRPRAPIEIADVRARVADALGGLAARVEPALNEVLRRARQAWDQADALAVLDDPLRAEIATLRRWLARLAAPGRDEVAAAALEGLLAIDAAVAMIRLFERRLAALLRLQLRSGDQEFLPHGRPFLDLAGALREAERAWR
ncbi:MAG TPA: hypothetical protein VHU40_10155 [Polyangia bacterium]|nr:hypothetical protein [Polyangia bacterium]